MNIFFTDMCPRQAAINLGNKHVLSQLKEAAQMLSTAHRLLDGFEQTFVIETGKVKIKKKWILPDDRESILYNVTHVNHPCAVWVREAVENYNWLVDHLFALGDEYTHRYGKVHKTIRTMGLTIQSPPFNLKDWDWTEPPKCMPDEYKTDDLVESYRNYYNGDKKHIHKWKNREVPEWIE